MKKSLGLKIGVVVVAVLVCLFAIFPFIWMISVSFKPASEVYAAPTLFPKAPTLDGYKAMLSTTGAFSFTTWLRNSVIVSLCTTLFSMIIATLGAYGFILRDAALSPTLSSRPKSFPAPSSWCRCT